MFGKETEMFEEDSEFAQSGLKKVDQEQISGDFEDYKGSQQDISVGKSF